MKLWTPSHQGLSPGCSKWILCDRPIPLDNYVMPPQRLQSRKMSSVSSVSFKLRRLSWREISFFQWSQDDKGHETRSPWEWKHPIRSLINILKRALNWEIKGVTFIIFLFLFFFFLHLFDSESDQTGDRQTTCENHINRKSGCKWFKHARFDSPPRKKG